MFYHVSIQDDGMTYGRKSFASEPFALSMFLDDGQLAVKSPAQLQELGLPASPNKTFEFDASFNWLQDPGHGWLQVDRTLYEQVCARFGWNASTFSYQDDEFVYLEEDCDGPSFIRLLNTLVGTRLNNLFLPQYHSHRDGCGWVRNLERIEADE